MATIANSTYPEIPADVAARTGPRLLGFMFHWGLFGALCVQIYIYHLAFQKDPIQNKALVYTVFVIELAQTVFFTQSAFYIFASGYGDFADFEQIRFTWFSAPLLTGIVAFIAQSFYAYRIRVLSRSYIVAGITAFLALVQLGGAISTAVVQKHTGLITLLLGHNYSISAGIWNGTSALCDVIIASSMTYYLSRRGTEAMTPTKMILKRITALVIETGTITAMVAIVNLVLSVLPSKPSYFLASSLTLGKVYSNSMMAVLNGRMRVDELTDGTTLASPSGNAGTSSATAVRYRNGVVSHPGLEEAYEMSKAADGIKVTREELVFPDPDRASDTRNEELDHGGAKGFLV
ncbi:hypothetical protein JR316_0011802 [Psilocybe cubensis]|uniref:DUF6534 domain-containing protein n=2 Tax=Psilocybe cubensis TaxID=181762 RepID=A0A8H8CFA5_PSICU|nr:hypothetical protein JR316_0011802 [Psilocybe cubensis]KAH9476231.1 hypothetical protein JR316_0011802 [Psilocybe cubensis]